MKEQEVNQPAQGHSESVAKADFFDPSKNKINLFFHKNKLNFTNLAQPKAISLQRKGRRALKSTDLSCGSLSRFGEGSC